MDAKTLFKTHGEKIALLVGFLVLAGYVVMGMVIQSESPVVKDIEGKISAAKNREANTPPMAKLPGLEDVRKQWKLADDLAQPRKMEWVAYYRTKVVPDLHEGPKVDVIALYPPELSEPSIEIGKVALSWSNSKNTNAAIEKWEVYRQTGGAGAWEKIAETKGDETSYTDDKTVPKTTYAYKVKVVAAAVPKVTEKKGDESNSVSATTPNTVSIRFTGGSQQMAIIEVQKFLNGQWLSQKDNVRPLAPDAAPPADGKIGHLETRKIDGKYQKVDLATGYILLAITQEPKEKVMKVKKTKRVEDPSAPGGNRFEEVEVEEKTTVTTLKIKYKDDAGVDKEMWQEEAGSSGGPGATPVKKTPKDASPKAPDKPKDNKPPGK